MRCLSTSFNRPIGIILGTYLFRVAGLRWGRGQLPRSSVKGAAGSAGGAETAVRRGGMTRSNIFSIGHARVFARLKSRVGALAGWSTFRVFLALGGSNSQLKVLHLIDPAIEICPYLSHHPAFPPSGVPVRRTGLVRRFTDSRAAIRQKLVEGWGGSAKYAASLAGVAQW